MLHMFQEPVFKKVKEMQPGDCFRCEFEKSGHYENFVFEKCEPLHQNTKINCHRIDCASQEVVDLNPIDRCILKVIGKEITK